MLIIERIEGNIAIIENDEEHFQIPISELPGEAKENDILIKTENGYVVDNTRKAEIQKSLKELETRLRNRK